MSGIEFIFEVFCDSNYENEVYKLIVIHQVLFALSLNNV